ncbi:hypothetical protein FA95DRAFT_1609025 [Auriscalpium vulgare]|uniref:Uncharacterized protein n=1 Tax=Auriscalpium vulgare TaxID=40419 RepID=A0ACB8RI87_9AGAM|nr:hypothetical protein FA95DRAFT_1609025 [Auriscalpium vulgare]
MSLHRDTLDVFLTTPSRVQVLYTPLSLLRASSLYITFESAEQLPHPGSSVREPAPPRGGQSPPSPPLSTQAAASPTGEAEDGGSGAVGDVEGTASRTQGRDASRGSSTTSQAFAVDSPSQPRARGRPWPAPRPTQEGAPVAQAAPPGRKRVRAVLEYAAGDLGALTEGELRQQKRARGDGA